MLKWLYPLNWLEYFDKLLHKHWYWQDLAQKIAKWHFSSGRAPSSETMKMMALSLELSGKLWWNFAYTFILTRCSPWDCQMTFWIGRGFAEVQILKKWNWPYLMNLLSMVYFDKILHTYYYWHALDRGNAKSSSRYWTMTFNIGRGCAELQILQKGKMAEMSGQLWWNCAYLLILTRCSPRDCQMSLGLAEALPRFKFWKQWTRSYLLKLFENFDNTLRVHVYTLLLTWARQRDCQMSFIISRGYAEVQILKTSKTDPLTFWNILICSCPNSA